MLGMNTVTPTPGARPWPDMQAVARGEPQALALAVASLAAFLFTRAGSSIKFPTTAVDVAHKAIENGPQAGLLAAAIDLRALLAISPHGRKSLRDLGFEPVLKHLMETRPSERQEGGAT